MWEIVLGALVVIGIFVFWCDVTDAWNNVFGRSKDWKTLIRAFLPPYSKYYLQGSYDSTSGVRATQHPDSIDLAKEVR